MMAKPMKTLELHYPMIQFSIIDIILNPACYLPGKRTSSTVEINVVNIEHEAVEYQ